MTFPTMIQGNNVIILIDGEAHTIGTDHINYLRIRSAIQRQDWAEVESLVDVAKAVRSFSQGKVEIRNGEVFYAGKEMHNALTKRMIALLREGFPIGNLVNFLDNLKQNPSKHAVDELYGFLEKSGLPITEDGYFIAYKKVRNDYKDVHTGEIDNTPGQVVEMPRNEVDDNRDNTCSSGLHFCSQSYLNQFGGDRTVLLKINPRDVVSIPSDYNDAKGRTCRYEVLQDLTVTTEELESVPVYQGT